MRKRLSNPWKKWREGRKNAGLGEFSSTTSLLHRIREEYFIQRRSFDENERAAGGGGRPGWVNAQATLSPALAASTSVHPPSPWYGLLTGNLPRLLLTVLSLYSPALHRFDGKLSTLSLSAAALTAPRPSLCHSPSVRPVFESSRFLLYRDHVFATLTFSSPSLSSNLSPSFGLSSRRPRTFLRPVSNPSKFVKESTSGRVPLLKTSLCPLLLLLLLGTVSSSRNCLPSDYTGCVM